jgi:hypothetical protein
MAQHSDISYYAQYLFCEAPHRQKFIIYAIMPVYGGRAKDN